MKNLSKIVLSMVLFSLAACSTSTIVACPEVPVWTQSEQTSLLKEISPKVFKDNYPYAYKALKQYQTMRITSKPCAIGERHIIQNLPSFPPREG